MPRKKNEKYKKWVDAVNATPAHIVSALQNDGRLCDDANCPVKRGHSAALDSLWKLTDYGYADITGIRNEGRTDMHKPVSGAFSDILILDDEVIKEPIPVSTKIRTTEETDYLLERMYYEDEDNCSYADIRKKIKIIYDGKEVDNVEWRGTQICVKTIKEEEYATMGQQDDGTYPPNHPFSKYIKVRRPIIFDPPPIGSIVSDIGLDIPNTIHKEEADAGKIESHGS